MLMVVIMLIPSFPKCAQNRGMLIMLIMFIPQELWGLFYQIRRRYLPHFPRT